jgi:hypothetical protein
MNRKHTLDEQIKRMKQLSTYNKSIGKYQFLNEDAPANMVGQPAQPQAQQPVKQAAPQQQGQNIDQQLDQLLNSPQFDQELNKAVAQVTQALPADLKKVATTTGDRDGQLEVQNEQQELRVNEGILMAAGAILAAPKIIELMGQGLNKLGVKVNAQTLQKVGNKMSHFGHAIHNKYVGAIETILKPMTQYMDDQQRHQLAGTILTMIVAGLGVASIHGAISAAQAGHAALATAEGGLSAIKGLEIAEKVRELLPAALQAGGAA